MQGGLHVGVRTSACVVALAWALSSVALCQAPPQAPVSQPPPKHTILDPAANRPPDANDIMLLRQQQVKRKNFDAANLERKRQLDEDSALLLKLVGELNTEISKASGEAPDLMRKLDDIERLAHNLQEKMKLTVGAS
jgi:hypothetical protein